MKYFEDSLRRLAVERGISNAEVARRCGIEARTYANYCEGKRKPDLNTLVRICQRMGVTPNDLLLEDADSAPSQRHRLTARATAALDEFGTDELDIAVVALEAIAARRRRARSSEK